MALPANLVPVYHSPLSPRALTIARDMDPPGGLELLIGTIDTVMARGTEIHFGKWGADFDVRNMRLLFEKSSDPCCICLAEGCIGIGRADCLPPLQNAHLFTVCALDDRASEVPGV
jgi:hypothetical protein